jgi:hypothetical protein
MRLIAGMRTVCLIAAALALSGCASYSSYSPLIAKSRAEYEQVVLSGRGATARRVYATRRIRRPAVAAAVDGTPTGSVAVAPASATAPRAVAPRNPSTIGSSVRENPYPVGSAEWHAEWRRMDENLQRNLNSICRSC